MRLSFRIILIPLLIVLTGISLLQAAERGEITGTVFSEAGEPLAGANILVKGTSVGASADVEGVFRILRVPAGNQQIRISYIGYETKSVPVTVLPGDVVEIQVVLKEKSLRMKSVSVVGHLRGNTDGGVLTRQRKSLTIENGISSDQMARSGDANAADALRRITGASVKDGKYVTVRGLAERYSNTQMNGSPITSPEPDKRAVPLTLFPTAILESISVIKTFTPDLPGGVTGGLVNIQTKAYPDNYVFNIKVGAQDNSNLRGAGVFRRSEGGALDYFGFDDGTRSMPNDIPRAHMLSLWAPPQGTSYSVWRQKLSRFGQEFQTSFRFKNVTPSKPVSISTNLGNHFQPRPDLEYGYFLNGSFSNNFNLIESDNAIYSLSDHDYVAINEVRNSRSDYKTNLALGFSTGVNWRKVHKLKLYYLYTHFSTDDVIYGTGRTPNIDQGVFIKQKFSEKSLRNLTLTGNHQLNPHRRVEWKVNLGTAHLNEPDEKTHNYLQVPGEDRYTLVTSSTKAGTRAFTSGRDLNGNLDVNYLDHISVSGGKKVALKLGFRIQGRRRDFRRRTFYHWLYGNENRDFYTVEGKAFGSVFNREKFFSDGSMGWVLLENTDESSRSAYRADERTLAQFIMVTIPFELAGAWVRGVQLITGVRREAYRLDLTPYNGVTGVIYENPLLKPGETRGAIREVTYLPSVNLIMTIRGNMKLRSSYSRTLARPQFRELAPLEYQEFYGGDVTVGYQNLVITSISNYDLRFEWYPRINELLSVSTFWKTFQNPIEAARFETADLTYKTYQNSPQANTYGLELEVRKYLPLFSSWGQMMAVFNTTWSRSEVETRKFITLFNGKTIENSNRSNHRPLQGQSNVLVNGELSLETRKELRIAAAFNLFSKRLVALGSGALSDIYEYPFPSLNVTVAKALKNYSVVFKVQNVLDSTVRFGQIEPGGGIKLTRLYHPGRSVSVGIRYTL